MAIYYLEEANILFRRDDDQELLLPNQVLGRKGWKPYREARVHPGSTHFTTLETISLNEAFQVAEDRNLPTEGW